MAERYGGKYSPGSATEGVASKPLDGRVPQRMAMRTNLLFLVPVPLAIKAFFAEPIVMAQYLLAFGALMAAAWLTRDGIRAEDAYDARKVARPPAFPRKMFGSALTGLGLGLTGIAGFGPIEAIVFAVLGAGLHFAAFGPDPLKSKGVEEHGDFQTDRVARVVDEAEEHLSAIQTTVQGLRDRRLSARVEGFLATARKLCRMVEDDP
ncbi:MAG: hypothetical protein AAF566_14010, partial [Pseudomonadota bacterium]